MFGRDATRTLVLQSGATSARDRRASLTAEKPVLEQAVTAVNSRKSGGGEAHICVS